MASSDAHYCLRSFNDGLRKLGIPTWGGEATNAGNHIEKRGYVRVNASDAMPGDIVVYRAGHGHYNAKGFGHIGVLVSNNGEIRLFSNLNGNVGGNQNPWLHDSKTEIWRYGGGQ